MILMLAAGTLLLLNGLMGRGIQPPAADAPAPQADEADGTSAEA
jgi:hypothetical protein